MSKIALSGSPTGTGVFTIESPSSNTSRTLVLPNEAGTVLVNGTTSNVGIGTSSPSQQLHVNGVDNKILIESADYAALQLKSGSVRTFNLQSINDGSGALRIYDVTAGTERMRIDSAGRVTMPYQPCFNALNGSAQSGVGVVIYDTTSLNVGSGYSTSTNRFTAPVAGNYFFSAFALKNPSTDTVLVFAKNGTYVTGYSDSTGSDYTSISVSGVVSLAAGDYVTVQTTTGSSGIYSNYRNFSGFLIG